MGPVVANLATLASDALEQNPAIQAVLESLAGGSEQPDVTTLFIVAVMQIVGMLAAAVGIQAVLRLREEEANGTTESLLAGPTSRWTLILSSVLIGTDLGAVACSRSRQGRRRSAPHRRPARGRGTHARRGTRVRAVGTRVRRDRGDRRGPVASRSSRHQLGSLRDRGDRGAVRQPAAAADELIDWTPWGAAPAIPVEDWTPVAVLLAATIGLVVLAAVVFRRRDLDVTAPEVAERTAAVLTANGFPAMQARVLMALVVSDEGRLTAAELAEQLEASPAAISGATRYLRTIGFVHLSTVPGTRKHRYELTEHAWYMSSMTRSSLYRSIALVLENGVRDLPAGPGRDRLKEMEEFFLFLDRRLPELLEEWKVSRRA